VRAIGSAKEIVEALSIRLCHASTGIVATTLELFSQACVNYPKSASLALEKAIFLIENRNDFWQARRELDKVCSMQDELHLSGESTRILAEAFKSAAMLWTGAAEEGLEALERSLYYLLDRSRTCESLRPLLAVILLERSYYWATHGDKKASVCDLSEALANCAYPQLDAKANLIREEIRWRFERQD